MPLASPALNCYACNGIFPRSVFPAESNPEGLECCPECGSEFVELVNQVSSSSLATSAGAASVESAARNDQTDNAGGSASEAGGSRSAGTVRPPRIEVHAMFHSGPGEGVRMPLTFVDAISRFAPLSLPNGQQAFVLQVQDGALLSPFTMGVPFGDALSMNPGDWVVGDDLDAVVTRVLDAYMPPRRATAPEVQDALPRLRVRPGPGLSTPPAAALEAAFRAASAATTRINRHPATADRVTTAAAGTGDSAFGGLGAGYSCNVSNYHDRFSTKGDAAMQVAGPSARPAAAAPAAAGLERRRTEGEELQQQQQPVAVALRLEPLEPDGAAAAAAADDGAVPMEAARDGPWGVRLQLKYNAATGDLDRGHRVADADDAAEFRGGADAGVATPTTGSLLLPSAAAAASASSGPNHGPNKASNVPGSGSKASISASESFAVRDAAEAEKAVGRCGALAAEVEPTTDDGFASCQPGELCTVCHDAFEAGAEVVELPCRHCFHEDCIIPWLQQQNTCPVCRARLTEGSNHSNHSSSSSSNNDRQAQRQAPRPPPLQQQHARSSHEATLSTTDGDPGVRGGQPAAAGSGRTWLERQVDGGGGGGMNDGSPQFVFPLPRPRHGAAATGAADAAADGAGPNMPPPPTLSPPMQQQQRPRDGARRAPDFALLRALGPHPVSGPGPSPTAALSPEDHRAAEQALASLQNHFAPLQLVGMRSSTPAENLLAAAVSLTSPPGMLEMLGGGAAAGMLPLFGSGGMAAAVPRQTLGPQARTPATAAGPSQHGHQGTVTALRGGFFNNSLVDLYGDSSGPTEGIRTSGDSSSSGGTRSALRVGFFNSGGAAPVTASRRPQGRNGGSVGGSMAPGLGAAGALPRRPQRQPPPPSQRLRQQEQQQQLQGSGDSNSRARAPPRPRLETLSNMIWSVAIASAAEHGGLLSSNPYSARATEAAPGGRRSPTSIGHEAREAVSGPAAARASASTTTAATTTTTMSAPPSRPPPFYPAAAAAASPRPSRLEAAAGNTPTATFGPQVEDPNLAFALSNPNLGNEAVLRQLQLALPRLDRAGRPRPSETELRRFRLNALVAASRMVRSVPFGPPDPRLSFRVEALADRWLTNAIALVRDTPRFVTLADDGSGAAAAGALTGVTAPPPGAFPSSTSTRTFGATRGAGSFPLSGSERSQTDAAKAVAGVDNDDGGGGGKKGTPPPSSSASSLPSAYESPSRQVARRTQQQDAATLAHQQYSSSDSGGGGGVDGSRRTAPAQRCNVPTTPGLDFGSVSVSAGWSCRQGGRSNKWGPGETAGAGGGAAAATPQPQSLSQEPTSSRTGGTGSEDGVGVGEMNAAGNRAGGGASADVRGRAANGGAAAAGAPDGGGEGSTVRSARMRDRDRGGNGGALPSTSSAVVRVTGVTPGTWRRRSSSITRSAGTGEGARRGGGSAATAASVSAADGDGSCHPDVSSGSGGGSGFNPLSAIVAGAGAGLRFIGGVAGGLFRRGRGNSSSSSARAL